MKFAGTMGTISIMTSVVIISIIYLVIILHIIEKNNQQIPPWVDASLQPILYNKHNIHISFKLLHILYGTIIPFYNDNTTLYCSWSELENNMDHLINIIRQNNIHIDYIVGIKSGGAIIAKYMSDVMHIDHSNIKLMNKDYRCSKKPKDDFLIDIEKRWSGKTREYEVCETIDTELKGKSILIVDEQISSGVTMQTTIDYLIEEKSVGNVYPMVLTRQSKREYPFDVIYATTRQYAIWPWGYDN